MSFAFSFFRNFPSGHKQRFIIDGELQKIYRGPSGYNRNEPGSFEGMLEGFAYLLAHPDQKIEVILSKTLHGIVMRHKKDANPGKFRNNYTHIPIGKMNTSLEGLTELCYELAHDLDQESILKWLSLY